MRSDRARLVVALLVVALVASAAIVAAISFTSEPTYMDGEVVVGVDNGPNVTIVADGQTQINMDDIWGTQEANIETEKGNITIGGDPGANATINVDDIEGTETVVTGMDGGSKWLYLNPDDKQRLDIRGDVSAVQFKDAAADDGTHDLEIVGTDGGTAEIRLYNLSANTDYSLQDPSSGQVLVTNTTDSSGTLTASVPLTSSNQQLSVRTVDDFTDPSLSNPSPTGQVTELPDQLSVDVEGEAWPANVTFWLEGEKVNTVETSSNGTVSTTVNVEDLGAYNWSARIEDATGQTAELNASFETPSELVVREETEPGTIVNDTTVTLRFYTPDGEIAIERQTDNGSVPMAGLPDSEFVVFVESEGYYDRRVFLESIFKQSNVYVLNETAYPRGENEAVASRFVYTDLTGDFPRAETTVQVQRAIDLNGDGTSEYRTVAGDYWGAGGEFQVILEHGARYRLFVENQETGATDTVGTHIPTEDLTYEIRTSGLVQEAQNSSGVFADATMNTSDKSIQYVYKDPNGETEDLRVVVRSKDGNTTLVDKTISGPLGTYRGTVDLNQSQLEQNWIVELKSDRHNVAIPVGSGEADFPVDFPGWIITLLGSMAVTFVGALYGPRTAVLGAWAMVFVSSGLAMFGWAFGWPSVLTAMLIATGMTFYGKVFP